MKKKRRGSDDQAVCVLKQTGGVEFVSLETDTLYAASPESIEAWEIDPNQQARNEKDGVSLQIVSEISKQAIKIYPSWDALKGLSTDKIASKKQDEELAFMESRRSKNSMLLWLGIICLVLALTVGLIVLIKLMQGPTAVVMALSFMPAILSRNKNGKHNLSFCSTLEELEAAQAVEDGFVYSLVVNENKNTWGFKYLDRELIPDESRERDFKNKPFYVVGYNNEGLYPIEAQKEVVEGESPQDLFIALQYEQEVDATYSLTESAIEKIKLGIFIGLAVFLMIILMMISLTVMGG